MAVDERAANVIKQRRSFRNWLASYKIEVPFFIHKRELLLFHQEIEDDIIRVIRRESDLLGPLKFSYTMLVYLKKDTNRGEEHVEHFFRQDIPSLLNAFNTRTVKGMLKIEINKMRETAAGWVERGSGWAIDRIMTVYLDFTRYNPIKAALTSLFLQN